MLFKTFNLVPCSYSGSSAGVGGLLRGQLPVTDCPALSGPLPHHLVLGFAAFPVRNKLVPIYFIYLKEEKK